MDFHVRVLSVHKHFLFVSVCVCWVQSISIDVKYLVSSQKIEQFKKNKDKHTASGQYLI